MNKGIRQEYKVKKFLESKGYYVVRSAGSHGIYDLVAIGETDVLLIQLKYGSEQYLKYSAKEKENQTHKGMREIKPIHLEIRPYDDLNELFQNII